MKKGVFNPLPLLFILFILTTSFFVFKQSTIENTYEPLYPNPSNNVLYEPIFGTIECKLTNNYIIIESPTASGSLVQFVRSGGNAKFSYHWVECPAGVGGDCKVTIYNFKCADNYHRWIRIGDSEWELFTQDTYTIPQGRRVRIDLVCTMNKATPNDNGLYYSSTYPNTYICGFLGRDICDIDSTPPWYVLKIPERKLYVTDPEGRIRFGWLEGSSGCKLVSQDAYTLKNLQPTEGFNVDSIQGIEEIPFGVSKHIVVGWRKSSVVNINPLGKYKGYDVICRPFDGIYSVKKIGTYGGKTYWSLGNLLISYAQDNSLCCGNSNCAFGYECEDYHCVKEPTKCQLGECNPNFFVETENCVMENNHFYLKHTYCDNDGCIRISKKEVKCCRDYCTSTFGQDYYCNYDVGCVKTSYLKECPVGYCCLEGGEYKERGCPKGFECCVGINSGGDGKFKGVCLKECAPEKDEICYNKVDDDGDGVVDEKPCVIDCSITPNVEECNGSGGSGGSKKFSLWWLILVGGLIGGVFSLLNPIPNKKLMIAKTIFFVILGLIVGFAVAYVIKLIIIAIMKIGVLLSV